MYSKILMGTTFLAAVIVVGGAALGHYRNSHSAALPVPIPAGTINNETAIPAANSGAFGTQAAGSAPDAGAYTFADVAKHASAQSCWTTIGGNVYDLTSWIYRHPGGPEAILSLCGKDGTSAFEAQHGGARRPARELQGFLIGTLSSQKS